MMALIREHQLDIMLSLASICGIMAVLVLLTGMDTRRKRTLFFFEGIAMLLQISERYSYIFRGDPSVRGFWMVRISNYLVFALTMGLVLIFNLYLKEMFKEEAGRTVARKRFLAVDLLILAGEIVLLVSQFTGLYYTFDEMNRYHRSTGYIFCFLLPLVASALQFSVIVQYAGLLSRRMGVFLTLFTLAPIVAAVVQLFAYGVSLISMATVGAVILLYLFDLWDLNLRMLQSRKTAKRLHEQLETSAEIYRAAYDVDIQEDSYSEIMARDGRIREVAGTDRREVQQKLFAVVGALVDPSCQEEVLRFVDLSTLEERLKDRKTVTIEFLNTEDLWLRARFIASQFFSLDGRLSHVLGVIEDIDEERRERDTLIDLSERALAANEAKTAFLSNMSHEIRTPINAMLGMDEMILREAEDPAITGYAEDIRTAGQTLLGLVNDILDFSKIEAGKMEILPVEYDLSSMVHDLVLMARIRAEEKGLSLELDIDREIPRLLRGDEVRIKQVITNLLSNALKYTEEGTVTFRIGFQRFDEGTDRVLLHVSVQDTGIGIKPEDREKLFTRFERIEEERNRHIEGTGLGISISQGLLDRMGSFLEVESVYGIGSTFSFPLEQEVVSWEPLGDLDTAGRLPGKDRERYRVRFTAPEALVLAVDDHPMNLSVFQSLIKQTEVRTETAGGGDEALTMARGTRYDLIFLDHMMPGKDGIEVLHELRADPEGKNRDTKVICLTANAVSGAREQYLGEGFDDYLTKPIDPFKLEGMLLSFLPEEKIHRSLGEAAEEPEELPEELAALSGRSEIDLSAGIRNSGSAEGYLPMLRIFYDSVETSVREVDGLLADGDLAGYTIKIHALKSSARLIGAAALGEEAQRLEDAGKKGDEGYIRQNHEKFRAGCAHVREILRDVCGKTEEDPSGRPLLAREQLETFYQRIRAAAEEMDCDRLEEILEELDGYQVPEEEQERAGQIREKAELFDYEGVVGVLS